MDLLIPEKCKNARHIFLNMTVLFAFFWNQNLSFVHLLLLCKVSNSKKLLPENLKR